MIDSDDYFRQVVCYVHLNPVAAGIVDDPADFRFSGHRELMGFCNQLVVDRCATLDPFDNSTILYVAPMPMLNAKGGTLAARDCWRRNSREDYSLTNCAEQVE